MSIFVSPHDDDHALFGAFTCLREHPILVVVFDGHLQGQRGLPVTWQERASETAIAADILECSRVVRLGFSDAGRMPSPAMIMEAIRMHISGLDHLYIPAIEDDGHEQHNRVGGLCEFSTPHTRYATYTRNGGKTVTASPVPILKGEWIASKLQALSVYKSQMNMDPRMGCAPHFLRSQEEYYL